MLMWKHQNWSFLLIWKIWCFVGFLSGNKAKKQKNKTKQWWDHWRIWQVHHRTALYCCDAEVSDVKQDTKIVFLMTNMRGGHVRVLDRDLHKEPEGVAEESNWAAWAAMLKYANKYVPQILLNRLHWSRPSRKPLHVSGSRVKPSDSQEIRRLFFHNDFKTLSVLAALILLDYFQCSAAALVKLRSREGLDNLCWPQS